MAQHIPCSPECKIVGRILLDHPLSYALTATADVPAVYLQQFWKTIEKVLNSKDTIRFKLDTQDIMVGYQGVVDKTQINILYLFHAVVNHTNVDYAVLLWTTPRAHMTPTLTATSLQGKKRKQIAGETSSPQKQEE
uniref:Uncharacterized protein n=1 Tax=Tanacetum cinerariifolium TaxID=118510 RepID=A0A6L2K889_TANCI|nr:hypothetical protein [Tanacetum cinerariifolium]